MAILAEDLQKLLTPNEIGWREGLEDEIYHSDKSAVNFSSLKHMEKSENAFAKEYWGPRKKEKKRQRIGKLAHMALLEGSKFKERYVVMPEFESFDSKGNKSDSKNTTYYKNKVSEWERSITKDQIPITEEERTQLFMIIDSILSNKKAVKLLSDGKPELAGYWTDKETGINLRVKPDFLHFNLGIMVDFKTTVDARWEMFRKSVEGYRYDIQMAMYEDGVFNITGEKPRAKAWLVVEQENHFECRIHDVSPTYEDIGKFEYRRCLNLLAKAIDKGSFDQGGDEILIGEPTHWFMKKYLEMGVLNGQ